MTISTIADAVARKMLEVPDIKPDFSTGPAKAGMTLVNQILGIGTIIGIVAFIAAACLLMFAGLDSRNKTRAWVALGVAGVGAAVLGSIVAMMTFFGNIDLF
ncbi:hypothetical protein [Leucobacter chromiiresistens]|uniref:Uncharacterized protein n=1 Tax=Leucobacter chromiiresistens TaxID=1079994 RepID=A0A1H0ZZI7_9MICO|nr:hypothetical protein [Leucobacter chromiiresistens]SDQ32661.1 hypothetical protein SAMN04488565_2193 [Leucobacter chromiiresistens]